MICKCGHLLEEHRHCRAGAYECDWADCACKVFVEKKSGRVSNAAIAREARRLVKNWDGIELLAPEAIRRLKELVDQ